MQCSAFLIVAVNDGGLRIAQTSPEGLIGEMMTQSSIPSIPTELPPEEQERLSELRRYDILDTSPAASLDLVTHLATRIFHTPISLISLVDENRVWFKSKQGSEIAETPRDLSFCACAILGDEVFVVEDATTNSRFVGYMLVREAPHVRFYAGAPLRSANGHNLGTLCIMDQKPRELSNEERDVLTGLSKIVIDEFDLRLKSLELGDEAERLRAAEETAQQALARLERAQYDLVSEHISAELRRMIEVGPFPRTAFSSPWPTSTGL